jgi:hypothetical protein
LFPDIFKLLPTIPVAPVIAGMTKHFMFHFRWIYSYILRFLYVVYFIPTAFPHKTNDGYLTKRVSVTGPSSVVQFTCIFQWPSVYIKN